MEVGKKYTNKNSPDYFWECIAVCEEYAWAKYSKKGAIPPNWLEPYTIKNHDADVWEDYVEPKSYFGTRFVYLDKLSKNDVFYTLGTEDIDNYTCVGEVEFTYTEGKGLSVKVVKQRE